jgi:hypothetical protein
MDKYDFTNEQEPSAKTVDGLLYKAIDDQESENYSSDPFNVVPDITTPIYNANEHADNTRQKIAYGLLWLLAFIVACIFGTLWFTDTDVADIKEFAVILGPVITLVSAATGFYYGATHNEK